MDVMHRHTWTIVDQREQPSPIELIGTREVNGFGSIYDLAIKPVIVTRKCEKCGTEEVKRI